ncbi:hypothetical protein [Erythrobacter sp. JK5]|uniref:hypothetical protein n=1 Tax=Erythrobacter sp. JK5 TaxID=2829500 RepID=UPI001BACEDFA|nr:hypothetical protein [Erythrobacter sp. JK5]QUL39138.1 hypothetical protein KDC96_07375 [Erythrobacter sp. JK5]
MPLAPADALTKKLKWDDFTHLDKDPPKPGGTAQAALTDVDYSYTAAKVWSDDGKKYKMSQNPTITTRMHPDCWVANFVFDFPQAEQDELLKHEQLHYQIGVLAARDCAEGFNALQNKEYDNTQDATDEFNALFATLDVKKIQLKYDKDTHSQPRKFPVKQKAWATAIGLVSASKEKKLRPTLIASSLIDDTM